MSRRSANNTATRTARKQSGPREGTAAFAKGQATVARILEATRQILLSSEAGELTMRNVATHAGLHLNNVQYYFKTRDDLVHAFIAYLGERYQQSYDALLSTAGSDPAVRFQTIVRFNIEDCCTPQTRTLFVRLWALLNELDGNTGRLIGELYAINVRQLSAALTAIYPRVPAEEIARRATLISALVEGLMLVRGAAAPRSAQSIRLLEHAFTLAMQIADGPEHR